MIEPTFHVRLDGPDGATFTTTTPVTVQQAESMIRDWGRLIDRRPDPGWIRRAINRLPSDRTTFRILLCVALYHYVMDAILRVPGSSYDWFHLVTAMAVTPTVALFGWRYSE